jgi:hypothetical protein
MPFEPRAGDSGERERKEKQIQRPLHGLRRDAHPKRNLGRIRLRVDYPPQYAHYDKREHAQPQRLVELPVEVAGVRVYALLGPSGAKCEGDQNKDRLRAASAHAIAGDRVFPATMAVDDPGVGGEANLVYGHIRVPGDDGDQSINTFDFEYDKLITPRLAVSVGGTYAMQNNPTARGFDNFSVGLKYLLYVNEAHEFMTSVGVSAELGGTGSRAIADNFSTISPTIFAGNLRRASCNLKHTQLEREAD